MTAVGTYATQVGLKLRLGITDTTDDTLLQSICDWTNQGVESFTKRILAPFNYTNALFDGYDTLENGRLLLVPRGLLTITSLELATNTGAAFQTIPSTDYFIRPTAQERDPGWPGTELWLTDVPSSGNPLPSFIPGLANIRINGTGGWAATPDDVIDVALNVAVKKFKGRGSGGNANAFTTGADGEQTFTWLLSLEDKQTLSRYRLQQVVVV